MKKLFFLMSMLFILSTDTFAKPIHWHASGTAEIGRPKKNCEGIWLCIYVENGKLNYQQDTWQSYEK
ncbi:MAG: hypothetical protein IPG85_01905 [Bacteroidetes bacterium]|nr:hypothetical protein [Bacteroidota bacterium]